MAPQRGAAVELLRQPFSRVSTPPSVALKSGIKKAGLQGPASAVATSKRKKTGWQPIESNHANGKSHSTRCEALK
jgi:hypothetical protein